MKAVLKPILALTLISAVCAGALVSVDNVTRDPIAAAKERQMLSAGQKVLPPGAPVPEKVMQGETICFVSKTSDGQLVGFAAVGQTRKGYGGLISLMVGFTPDGKLYTYEVLDQAETPGLGTRIADPSFMDQLKMREAASLPWKVTKDGGDVDAITAATISSRAALEAIQDAANAFSAYRNN